MRLIKIILEWFKDVLDIDTHGFNVMKQNIIALVYDFDGTLTPKTMQEYTSYSLVLKLNPDKFWSQNSYKKQMRQRAKL